MNTFDELLDPTAARAWLERAVPQLAGPGFRVDRVGVMHAWRRIHASPRKADRDFLDVCYRLRGAAAHGRGPVELVVSGHAWTAGDHRPPPGARTLLRSGALSLALARIEEDPAMPVLAALTRADTAGARLPAAVSRQLGHAGALRVEVVSYRPRQRCVLRIAASSAAVFVKVFGSDEGASSIARAAALGRQAAARGAPWAVPGILAWRPADRCAWLAAAPGESPAALLGGSGAAQVLERIARALAGIHAARVPGTVRLDREALLAEAGRKLDKIARLLPDARRDAGRVRSKLGRELLRLPRPARALIHGDAHLDQFRIAAGRVTVLDLDEMAVGEPEQDLAALAVDLAGRAQRGDAPGAGRRQLCAGYARAAGAPVRDEALAWYLRLQWVNRAYRDLWQLGTSGRPGILRALNRAAGMARP